MPLPKALATKLTKRGIIGGLQKPPETGRKRDFRGVAGCPNKNNVYHDCSNWCESHWQPVSVPDNNYMRNVSKLLHRYPLPNHWAELFDRGIKRYYYWDMETDIVSWLPPTHPKAVCTESAARIREKYAAKGAVKKKGKSRKKRSSKASKRDRDKEVDSSGKRYKCDDKDYGRKRARRIDIDPMDPVAYSDVPVGTSSDGLESNKAGADSTASGALYQQRPYPAPGDILAAPKKTKVKKSVSFGGTSYSS